MEYPELTDEIKKRLKRPCMFCPSRIGEALILNVAFIATTKKEVKHIIAYSRPAGYRYYLARFFTMLANQHNNFIKPEEKIFFNKANKILN